MHGKKEPKNEIYKKKPRNEIYTPDGFHPSHPASEVNSGKYQGVHELRWVFLKRNIRWVFLGVCKIRGGFFLNIPYLASFASQNPVQQRCLVLSPRLQGENMLIVGSINPGIGDINCQSIFDHICLQKRGIVT